MKPPKRISPTTLRVWLSAVKSAINDKNYGIADDIIDKIMDCMETKYDWEKLKRIEKGDDE